MFLFVCVVNICHTKRTNIFIFILGVYIRSDVGRNHSGRSLDAVGASCRAVAVAVLLDAYGRSDVGRNHSGAVVALSWRVVAVVVLSDAYGRSDVGTIIRGGRLALMRSGILASGCRGRSVLMLADVRTLAQSFGAVARCGPKHTKKRCAISANRSNINKLLK